MKEDRNTPEYLAQLLKDKKQIQAFPNVFLHAERLIDEGKSSSGNARTPTLASLGSNRELILCLSHGIYDYHNVYAHTRKYVYKCEMLKWAELTCGVVYKVGILRSHFAHFVLKIIIVGEPKRGRVWSKLVKKFIFHQFREYSWAPLWWIFYKSCAFDKICTGWSPEALFWNKCAAFRCSASCVFTKVWGQPFWKAIPPVAYLRILYQPVSHSSIAYT